VNAIQAWSGIFFSTVPSGATCQMAPNESSPIGSGRAPPSAATISGTVFEWPTTSTGPRSWRTRATSPATSAGAYSFAVKWSLAASGAAVSRARRVVLT
jgi:hypothetical protein